MQGFINPSMLLLVVLVGIPVLIHLYRTSRPKPNILPTLDFVTESKHTPVREPKIVRRILLACRIGLLLAIVIAFARPQIFSLQNTTRDTRPPVSAAILIDNSLSMDMLITRSGQQKKAIEFARTAARSLVESLPQNSNMHLVTTTGAVWSSSSKKEIHEKLESIAIDPFNSQAVRGMNECLGWLSSEPPSRELHIISDFQFTSWESYTSVITPDALGIFYLELDDSSLDWSINSASFLNSHISLGEGVSLQYKISTTQTGARTLNLYLNNEKVASKNLTLGDNEDFTGSFELNFKRAGPNTLRLAFDEEDGLSHNNSLNIIADVNAPSKVLVINPQVSNQNYDAEIISLALYPPNADTQHNLMPESLSPPVTQQALDDMKAVVVLNPGALKATDLSVISQFLLRGGGALFFADPSFKNDDILLRDMPILKTIASSDARLVDIDYEHPVFSSFRDRANGALELTRFGQISNLNADLGRVLARFSTGGAACVEVEMGLGRLILFGAEPNELGGSFYREPPFLPFLHESMAHLKGLGASNYSFSQGDDIRLPIFEHDKTLTIKPLNKKAPPLEFTLSDYGSTFVYRAQLDVGGYIAEINGNERSVYFAVQPNADEFLSSRQNPFTGFSSQALGTKEPEVFAHLASSKRGGVEVSGIFSKIAGILFLIELAFSWYLTRLRSRSSGALLNRSGGV